MMATHCHCIIRRRKKKVRGEKVKRGKKKVSRGNLCNLVVINE